MLVIELLDHAPMVERSIYCSKHRRVWLMQTGFDRLKGLPSLKWLTLGKRSSKQQLDFVALSHVVTSDVRECDHCIERDPMANQLKVTSVFNGVIGEFSKQLFPMLAFCRKRFIA